MWTTDVTLKLIGDIYATPCLWDVSIRDYRNRDKRRAALEELAHKYKVSASELEKKIHTLKSQFRREHKKLTESEKCVTSPPRSIWIGYEPLIFLLSATKSRGSRSSDSEGPVSTSRTYY